MLGSSFYIFGDYGSMLDIIGWLVVERDIAIDYFVLETGISWKIWEETVTKEGKFYILLVQYCWRRTRKMH